MKTKLLVFVFALGMVSFVTRELCESIQFIKGATYEMEHLQMGKKTTSKMLVKEVTRNGNKKESIIHSEYYDEKGNKQSENDIKISCDGDKISIEMKDLINSKMGEIPNMEVTMENSRLEFPLNPSVGQSLPDNQFVMKMKDKKSGQEMGEMKTSFVNRKIVAKEKVTTPAGVFECWKASSDVKGQMRMMGMERPVPTMKITSYYNKEVGQVKSETHNEKGELMSTEILKKYQKP
jgi:hypothetical protein